MSARISLAHIGRKTGYSSCTVSQALRDCGSMSLTTRKKIKEVAYAMGYRPNPLLASLASKHFSASKQLKGTPLAFIRFPVAANLLDYKLFEDDNVERAREHGRKLGYHFEVFDAQDFHSGEQATRMLFARGIQGILLPHFVQPHFLTGMDWKRFSVVAMGDISTHSGLFPSLSPFRASIDHFGSVRKAWDEVHHRGYLRIGFALPGLELPLQDDEIRLAAALLCLQSLPTHRRIPPFVEGHMSAEYHKKLKRWIERYQPDAIIAFNAGIVWDVLAAGCRVPRDLAFAALNVEIENELDYRINSPAGRVAGMKHVGTEQIHVAIELLDQQIRHHHYGLYTHPPTHMVRSEWLDGDTMPFKTQPAKKSRAHKQSRRSKQARSSKKVS